MKKILITGTDSYIGNTIEKTFNKSYLVSVLDMKNNSWRDKDFSYFDVVIHLAAFVHKKEKHKFKELYFKVNRDLSIEVAEKAKKSGVKQFIFMSSMAIYGEVGRLDKEILINKDTKPNPITYYGKSKMEAEEIIRKLSDKLFKVVILRPPMVYGPNCPGNYRKLENFALKYPVFPKIENKRSMIHVDNLVKDIKLYIDKEVEGIYFQQDKEYINTSLLVKKIAEEHGRKIYLSRILGIIIISIGKRVKLFNKVFGNLMYEKNIYKRQLK